jgi:hypothetical protein
MCRAFENQGAARRSSLHKAKYGSGGKLRKNIHAFYLGSDPKILPRALLNAQYTGMATYPAFFS